MDPRLDKLLEKGSIKKKFYNSSWHYRFTPNNTNEMGVLKVTHESLEELVDSCYEVCSFLFDPTN